MQASMQWFKGLQIKRTMNIDRFEIMKNTFSQTFTINYYPNTPSLPLYSLTLLLISTTSHSRNFKKNKTKPKKINTKHFKNMGWFMSGRKVGKRKFSWKYRQDNRDNQQCYGIAFFDQHCCLLFVWDKTPCLIYFPRRKFHFAEETQMTLVAL